MFNIFDGLASHQLGKFDFYLVPIIRVNKFKYICRGEFLSSRLKRMDESRIDAFDLSVEADDAEKIDGMSKESTVLFSILLMIILTTQDFDKAGNLSQVIS